MNVIIFNYYRIQVWNVFLKEKILKISNWKKIKWIKISGLKLYIFLIYNTRMNNGIGNMISNILIGKWLYKC